MTPVSASALHVQQRRLIGVALIFGATAGAGRWLIPQWQAHPFLWFWVTGLLFGLARLNHWWKPETLRRIDALWPLAAFCWLATLLVVQTDDSHIFSYDRFFPFLWLCCYAFALFQAGRGAALQAGWIFFFAGICYGMAGIFYQTLTQYGWLYFGGSLAAGHLCWAWLLRRA